MNHHVLAYKSKRMSYDSEYMVTRTHHGFTGDEEKRLEIITLRLTKTEKAFIRAECKRRGFRQSELFRFFIFKMKRGEL